MIISSEQLLFENSAYANPQCRVQTLVKKGALIPLKRGLFETEANTPGFILANALLGPSYLSFEYALSYYGMIPERVMTYTSATFGKNKKIEYKNTFGTFTYRDISAKIFPYFYTRALSGKRPYLIATKEKALCDQLSIAPPIRGRGDFEAYLFDDMRIDEELFGALNTENIIRIAPLYHRTNLDQLVRLIEKKEHRA